MDKSSRTDTLNVRTLKRASGIIQPVNTDFQFGKLKRSVSKSLKRTLSGVRNLTRSRTYSQAPVLVPNSSRPRRSSLSDLPPHDISEEPIATSPLTAPPPNVSVPFSLQQGLPMTKVSNKRRKKVVLRIEPDLGHLVIMSKSHKLIPLENIRDIRAQSDARFYREQFQLPAEWEQRWLTLSYIVDSKHKILHLIAETADALRELDETLRQLHAVRKSLMSGLGESALRQAVWERQYWTASDQEKDEKLVFEEVEGLCKRLGMAHNREDLLRIFKQADRQGRDYLDFEDFRYFVKLLKARPEVERLYRHIRSSSNGVFNVEAFKHFLRESQRSTASDEEIQTLFNLYASGSKTQTAPADLSSTTSADQPQPTLVMSKQDFTTFLLSSDNPSFSDRHSKVWHDMTRPLSEYFVSSSHNTYLVGNQLMGDSTIEGYIRALLYSCRSVEIDIYDGAPPLSEPMIFHGKTLTSKVSLREVCEAIKKYGFMTSPYPIIISAEVHCGLVQQDLIAKIMLEVFGDALIRSPLADRPKLDALPSPDDLKGKILLKTKNHMLLSKKLASADSSGVEGSSSTTSESETPGTQSDRRTSFKLPRRESVSKHVRRESDAVREQALNMLKRVRSGRRTSSSHEIPVSTSPPDKPGIVRRTESDKPGVVRRTESDKPGIVRRAESDKPPMSFALAELLVYTVGVRCRGINKKEEYAPEHMFSLSENTMNKMVKTGMLDLIKHSRSHLIRIYPKGMRLRSTNYEPHHYWVAGAQLVALNWQTVDIGTMINHAMFQRNGRSGYVLKPPALTNKDKSILLTRKKHILDLTVISAQQLSRPKDENGHEINNITLSPFVEVSLHIPDWSNLPLPPATPTQPPPLVHQSSSNFARSLTYKTNVIKNNGFNPLWEERFRIPFDSVGDMLDLCFLRFVVRHEGDDDLEPLGIYCISLGSLQTGYRHLPLHDSHLSQYLFSTLFIKSALNDA